MKKSVGLLALCPDVLSTLHDAIANRMLVTLALGAMLLAGLSQSGCVTYSGISRSGDDVYLVGSTSYLIFGKNWVKKCTEGYMGQNRTGLSCQELPIHEVGPEVSWGRCTPNDSTQKSSATICHEPLVSERAPGTL